MNNIKDVFFNEEEHRYFYHGKELKGITACLCKYLGKVFPDNAKVQVATLYGKDVHKESELFIKENKEPSTESGKWLKEEYYSFCKKNNIEKMESEVLVSDFESTASCIDLVFHTKDGVYLADIKTTSKFDRHYCSLQLSIYKKLYEQCYRKKVKGMFVFSTSKKFVYRIFEQDKKELEKILQINKNNT